MPSARPIESESTLKKSPNDSNWCLLGSTGQGVMKLIELEKTQFSISRWIHQEVIWQGKVLILPFYLAVEIWSKPDLLSELTILSVIWTWKTELPNKSLVSRLYLIFNRDKGWADTERREMEIVMVWYKEGPTGLGVDTSYRSSELNLFPFTASIKTQNLIIGSPWWSSRVIHTKKIIINLYEI